MSTLSQPRVPAGTPVGGRWTGRRTAEVHLDLTDIDRGSGPCVADRLTEAEVDSAFRYAHQSGSFYASRYGIEKFGVSGDDIASETLADWWRAMTRSRTAPADMKSYIHKIARQCALRSIVGGERSEDRQAIADLDMWQEDFEQEHHREPTGEETDRAAEAIRMAQPPGRRARIGFQHPQKRTTLEVLSDLADQDAHGSSHGETSGMEMLLDRRSAEGKRLTLETMAGAWSVLAAPRDAPSPVPGSLDTRSAFLASRTVSFSGGAGQVSRKWMSGECSRKEAKALFAPFGAIDETGRDRVACMLRDTPAYATNLWEAALKVAASEPSSAGGECVA